MDYAEWSPDIDPYSNFPYSAQDLSGKRLAKRALMEEVGLPQNEVRPLIGIVSRFAGQKGFDLLEEIAPELAEMDLAMAVLGSGEAPIEAMFRAMAKAHPEKFAVRGWLRQRSRAPHRSRRRHVPDAQPVRALRLKPDV